MPKGTPPGKRIDEAVGRWDALKERRRKNGIRVAHEYEEDLAYPRRGLRAPGTREAMRDVRSSGSTGGALSRINENPVKALKRRADQKTPAYKKGGMVKKGKK